MNINKEAQRNSESNERSVIYKSNIMPREFNFFELEIHISVLSLGLRTFESSCFMLMYSESRAAC